jgi:hypothetical protein
MLHKHLKDTFDGLTNVIISITFGSISLANIGTLVGIVSGLFASAASLYAILYYAKAIRKLNEKK